ncbi:hypothetical protein D9757_001722 [Collybiopsis confluens]|uniref:Uncharacterized protein n=1 Tax=Collybiopsis confluens TaxID=2823264 RepID=A0A8H5HZ62_9AGAR|nr:hypothetical protein D9757_001722 [Collybiopsis confluens]
MALDIKPHLARKLELLPVTTVVVRVMFPVIAPKRQRQNLATSVAKRGIFLGIAPKKVEVTVVARDRVPSATAAEGPAILLALALRTARRAEVVMAEGFLRRPGVYLNPANNYPTLKAI